MTFRTILRMAVLCAAPACAAPALLPFAAMAQPATGPYVSAGAGYNILGNQKINSITVNGTRVDTTGLKQTFKNGFMGEAAIGYGFGNGFRVELEGDYFRNKAGKFTFNNINVGQGGGYETKYGAMGNVLYDFDIGSPYIYPFIGGGLGYQRVNLSGSGAKGAFAYQGIAGLSFPIPGAVGLSATLQYRYLALTGHRTYSDIVDGADASIRLGPDHNNIIMAGVRYELFPPMPPAPPVAAPVPAAAPAPAPARTFLVFFNWNQANLTPRAMQIVSEAAQASQSTNVTRLNVNGYTDTSGTAAYNRKLSYRRADNVAAQLVRDGVAKSDIEIKGYGETHLLVPTGPGVREPQNRRVEIILG